MRRLLAATPERAAGEVLAVRPGHALVPHLGGGRADCAVGRAQDGLGEAVHLRHGEADQSKKKRRNFHVCKELGLVTVKPMGR